jgi:hypothetical protein
MNQSYFSCGKGLGETSGQDPEIGMTLKSADMYQKNSSGSTHEFRRNGM